MYNVANSALIAGEPGNKVLKILDVSVLCGGWVAWRYALRSWTMGHSWKSTH